METSYSDEIEKRAALDAAKRETLRFVLYRYVDVSGVSGTGIVADGILWPDQSCTIRWRGERPSLVHWHSVDHAISIHGHGGATEIEWID